MDYQPRIIRDPADETVAYLGTCRSDLAPNLVAWLKEQGIPASLSGAETNETMESDVGTDSYIVSEVVITPPINYDTVRAAVQAWPRPDPQ